MRLFRKKRTVDYETLISKLEIGNGKEISELLWQPKNATIDYLPITTDLIQKLKKDEPSSRRLSIHKKVESGRFELLIFDVPWSKDEVPYSPLLVDTANSKILGIMLPFNELHNFLSNKEHKMIQVLGVTWTGFVIKFRMKI